MPSPRIVAVEWGVLHGARPRHAGRNARLDDHGVNVRVPLARLTCDDGSTGFGRTAATPAQAAALVGTPLTGLFDPARGAIGPGLPFDLPLWDLMAKRADRPVYALAAQQAGVPGPETLRVPCYDTSLYIDDLHLADDDAAAALIAAEAHAGWERGHRAFKIKVGRGARHMPLEAGTRRDIAVIQAVRAAVGPDAPVMVDANNGYDVDTAIRFLEGIGETRLFCLPGFHFRAVDALFTNFHLPKSTLFMLVCAFAGTDRMKSAYAHAVAAGYRFFSYGDASLIERNS